MNTTATDDQAWEAARQSATGDPADRILERLAELLGAKATVQAVFAEPVRHGEQTVIGVARIRWGFGGGGGRSEAALAGPASGSGGGGGVAADPVGYLEIGPTGTTFRRISAAYPSPAFILAAGVTVAIVLRALARLAGR